jgi:probable HAF family extracellular repeat protein
MVEIGDGDAQGINSYGQVVGENASAAFLWTPTSPNGTTGSMVNLGTLPGWSSSIAYATNTPGQVVGESFRIGPNPIPPLNNVIEHRAFLWTPAAPNSTTGSMVDLGDLPGGADYSRAYGINSMGQVVGESDDDAPGAFVAFLWTPGKPNGTSGSMISLGDLSPSIDFSRARGINSMGQVVGAAAVGTAPVALHAFLWTPTAPNGTTGTMVDLGELPGGTNESLASAINSQGQVVGTSNAATGHHAFLWTPTTPNAATGVMFDLNDLLDPTSGAGWTLTFARGINDFGQIAGEGIFDPDGPGGDPPFDRRAFLLTPIVPEPSTTILIAMVLFMWTVKQRGRLGAVSAFRVRGEAA